MLSKLKALLGSLVSELKDIWNRGKMYLFGLLAIVVALEFRKLKEYLLLKQGQKEMKTDLKEDKDLSGKEQSANNQADKLVQDANNLPSQQQPVKEDWNTKTGDDK